MSFHPRMFTSVRGFEPLCDVRCLAFDQMTIDYWRVRGRARAGGHYVSMHPRLVFVLDDRRLGLTADKAAAPLACACCYIPGGMEVWGRVEQPGELRHLDLHLSHRRLQALIGPNTPLDKPIFLTEWDDLAGLTNLLVEEAQHPRRSRAHIERLAETLILELFHQAGSADQSDDPHETRLKQLGLYVRRNMEHRISVGDLATVTGMSRTNFTRIFRETSGQSPYQWVMEMKIGHAKNLLQQGMPFVEVASATGFSDQAHFNRMFKAATGLAPGSWIKQQDSDQFGSILQDIHT
ncbi:helix-turn-helix domain-containing protein [Puniceibacterium sediminis]|uniref:Helix-turn-helix domain-containing protein n=1 Tax=Puniceibacterium sediminis TaxID=1608407 RepID=A0A238WA56_9RHOB|nr:AraC family transcriptional regulator [Puniceibacterium sediminis]SNR43485.1 Helix-turn-helix domain-containing protein [Puniceibacterium sediminis]